MTPRDARLLGDVMLACALGAREIVMSVYDQEDRGLSFKECDDPVTRGDKEANAFLIEASRVGGSPGACSHLEHETQADAQTRLATLPFRNHLEPLR